ncbi:MAG TPA: histidine phosphatase family protein [Caulobacteraceae bacterium]|nr:histidine phosphatase family protein [Caulobacteraceae bacterium]
MTRVILVRHCESEANRAGPEGSGSNSPLSARGREQAEAVHAAFSGLCLGEAVLISSPLTRAAKTAEAIGRALGADIEFDARLGAGEIQAGRFDLDDPATLPIVGAEVLEALCERIEGGEVLIMVSHRYPIWSLLTRLYGNRGTELMDELNNLGNGDRLEFTLEGGAVQGEPLHRPLYPA